MSRSQHLKKNLQSRMCQSATTFASGLHVPKPHGVAIILGILRESGGIALAFPDEIILASLLDWASNESIFLRPDDDDATYDHLLSTRF
jgi:threonine synthase